MLFTAPEAGQHIVRPSPFQLGTQGESEKAACASERRSEPRTDVVTVVLVVPMDGEVPDISRAFAAITRDISGKGVGVVAHHFALVSEVLICLWSDGEPKMLHAAVRHRKEISRGWVRFGVEFTGTVSRNEYPELRKFVELLLA